MSKQFNIDDYFVVGHQENGDNMVQFMYVPIKEVRFFTHNKIYLKSEGLESTSMSAKNIRLLNIEQVLQQLKTIKVIDEN